MPSRLEINHFFMLIRDILGENGCISCFESEHFESITQEGGPATGSHENCRALPHLFYPAIDCPSDCQLETSVITELQFDDSGENIKNYVEKRTRRGCADIFSIRSYSQEETTSLCENEVCEMNYSSKCFDMAVSTTTQQTTTTSTAQTSISTQQTSTATTESIPQLVTTTSTTVATTILTVTPGGELLGEEIAIIVLSVLSFLMLFVIILLLYHLKGLKRKLRSKRIESRSYWIWNIQQPKYQLH